MQKIPKTADAAIDLLTVEGAIITAKEWARAALVYALVGPERGRAKSRTFPYNTVTLAKVGIVGLTTHDTVARYRDAWTYAMEQGKAEPVTFGSTYHEPDLPWPPNLTVGSPPWAEPMDAERRETLMGAGRDAGMGKGSKVADIAANPKALAVAIKADPATAKAAAEALAATPSGQVAAAKALNESEAAKALNRSMKRGHKEREALDDLPKPFTTGRLLPVLLELSALVEEAREATRDESSMEVMRLFAESLSYKANMMHAIVNGDLTPMDEDEFTAGIEAILNAGDAS